MQPDPRFLKQAKDFWANVRTISQEVGYTDRKGGAILVPTLPQIRKAFNGLNLDTEHIMDANDILTSDGHLLMQYFEYRANGSKIVLDGISNGDRLKWQFFFKFAVCFSKN